MKNNMSSKQFIESILMASLINHGNTDTSMSIDMSNVHYDCACKSGVGCFGDYTYDLSSSHEDENESDNNFSFLIPEALKQ